MAKPCYATQHSDQMICPYCGLVWDINDPEPPECRRDELPASRTPLKQQSVVMTTRNTTRSDKHE